jgi:hypothetical protein
MAKFKPEFENAKVTVRTATGKIEVNTYGADPNKWVNVPELAFMFEHVAPEAPTEAVSYEDMTLNELRALFPDIKANSKKAFLEQL